MRYFVRTVEAGNITRAAELLCVAQPALGLQIRQLEQELGVALLVRHSRGVEPTRAGRVLYNRAQDILRAVEETRREVAALGGSEREAVSLGITPGLVTLLGSKVLFGVRTELPGIHLSLVEEMSHVLVDMLERDELDLALSYEVPDRPSLLRIPLLEEELLLVTARPEDGAQNPPVPLDEVLRRPLVLTGGRDPVRQQMEAAATRLGLTLTPAFEASSVGAIKSVIASGAACGIMAYGSAASEIRQGVLGFRRIGGSALLRTLYLVRSGRRAAPRQQGEVQAFLVRAVTQMATELGALANPLPALGSLAGTSYST